ncbi:MAG: hypothetical protein M1368_05665 [Thaumarchaeota archaeon]|nr:hypothetical protein [Nitrososphaerota archaeon]
MQGELKNDEPLLVLSTNVDAAISKLRELDEKVGNLAELLEKFRRLRKESESVDEISNSATPDNPEPTIWQNKLQSDKEKFAYFQKEYVSI